MSQKRDYYEILGVAKDAPADEIRKAYRKEALKSHPDRNPGDSAAEARFKEATEAFQVLSDDDKRARYDRFGHAGLEGMPADPGNGDIFSHFQDIFSEFFGGGGGGGFGGQRRRGGPSRGQDLRLQQRLTLKDALLGCKREVPLRTPATCDDCAGTGAKAGTKRRSCGACGGVGQVSTSRGFVMFTQTCPECHGEGSVVKTPCPSCNGQGAVEKSRKVVVSFPPGVDNGQRLRVPGQGMAGSQGGPAGDLYVDIEVAQDEQFRTRRPRPRHARPRLARRSGAGRLDPPRPARRHRGRRRHPLRHAAGRRDHGEGPRRPRLDGRGKGSLQVVMQVDIPKTLSPRAKELLRELEADLHTHSPRLDRSKSEKTA